MGELGNRTTMPSTTPVRVKLFAPRRRSGSVLVAAALAEEYGFADVDGRQPRPLTLADV